MANKSESIYVYECFECHSEFHTDLRTLEGLCSRCLASLHRKTVVYKKEEEEIINHSRYECLACNHVERVRGKRKDYKEVLFCPKCNGLFIDSWHIHKYQHLKPISIEAAAKPLKSIEIGVDIDVSDALKGLKGLKAVERQAKKIIRALREIEELTKKE